MSEENDKTPEQVSDEDYKVAPTSADKERLNKQHVPTDKKEQEEQEQVTGENISSFPQKQT